MTKVRKITREELQRVCAATENLPGEEYLDEMAIPSYLHSNPLIRWIVWRRHILLAKLGEFDENMDVLDFGCGAGIFLPTLCQSGARVHAIDLFPALAEKLCEIRQLNVKFHEGIESIADGSLDVIVAAEVLEHMDSGLDELLVSFGRKLKSQGRLLVSVPAEERLYRWGRFLAGFGNKAHYHHRKGAEILERIAANGFIAGRQRGIPFDFMRSFYLIGEFMRSNR